MSDQNQWPKPGEQQSDGQRPDASAPAPGSAAEPNGYGQDTPQQQNPYAAPSQQQHGQQPSQPLNPYAAPAQQNPYAAPQQQYGQQQYGQQPQYGAPQNPYAQQQGQQGQQGQYNRYAQQQGQYNPYANTGYQPYGQRPKTNLLSILSIVFGLAAIPFFFIAILLGPAGAILGHLALGKVKQSGENGRGLALTGIIAGWVMTGVWIIWVVFLVWIGSHAGNYSDYGTDFGGSSGA